MKSRLRARETVLRRGPANLQRHIETVGGRLFLTSQRLICESHAFNIQTGTRAVELADIVSLTPCWTRFLGVLPLLQNSLAISAKQGETYSFVLFGRVAWRRAIARQISG